MQEYNFYKHLHVIWTDDDTRILDGISERELKEKFLRYRHRGYIDSSKWEDRTWRIIGEKKTVVICFDFTEKECSTYAELNHDAVLQEDARLFVILGMEKYGTRELEDLWKKTKKVLRLVKFGQTPEGVFQNETLMQPRNCPELMDFFRIFQPYGYKEMIRNLEEYMEEHLFPNMGLLRIHYQAMFRLEKALQKLKEKQQSQEACRILAYMHTMRYIPMKTDVLCALSDVSIKKIGEKMYLCDPRGIFQDILLSVELEREIREVIKAEITPSDFVNDLEKVYHAVSGSYYCIRTDEQLAERYGKRTLTDENLLQEGELIRLSLPIIRLLSIIIGAAYTENPEVFLRIAELPVTLEVKEWRIHTEKALLAEKLER